MNFVRLYIGDYLRDTGTLTVAEHGAYMLMLMHYYATEKPLPTGRELHRLLRAESKAERDAIDSICARFWSATDSGLVNPRADREIARAERQRDVNRETGKRGGRPKRTATEQETDSVSESEPNAKRTQTLVPDTRHQTPEEEGAQSVPRPSRARARGPNPVQAHIGGHDGADALPTDSAALTPAGRVCRAMRAAGLQQTNPGDPRLLALIEQDITDEEFIGVAAEAAKGGKGWAWVLKVVEARRADAAAISVAPRPQEPWHETRSGIEGKGEELGIGRWDERASQLGQGEHWYAYQARVFAAAGHEPRRSA